MGKDDGDIGGTVTEVLAGSTFRVRLDDDSIILAYAAGKARRTLVRTTAGDRVRVKVTPLDPGRGRIVR